MLHRCWFVRLQLFVLLISIYKPTGSAFGENDSAALSPRPRWTESRIVGTPEPPPPYTVEPAFKQVAWKNPIFAVREPGSEWMIFVEWPQQIPASNDSNNTSNPKAPSPTRFAPARAVRLLDRDGDHRPEPFLELADRAIYSLEFHPRYRDNGQIFACSKTNEGGINILSRFVVSRDKSNIPDNKPPVDAASEERILEWHANGHDGGAVVFGHDGMLYVSTGDGTADSDNDFTAQDAGNLLGKVLRIDVDHPAPGAKYAIPSDNPFVDIQGARGEIWSLGHRNPWRMTVDAKTGGLWVGNNGQDLWEFAHLIKRGDNCGWSVYEGSHPFYLSRQHGPGRLAPPTVEHDHGVFRSLTGGVVYYGRRHPDLEGRYIYGDYSTGAVWGAQHDGTKVIWNRELARTTLNIVAFATSHRGDVLIVDYASGIYRLIESKPDESHKQFPRRLSETGLFASVAELRPMPGAVRYDVAVPGWADGASAERLVALPNDGIIRRNGGSNWNFPEGTVLVQTLSLPQRPSRTTSAHRIETRVLTQQKGVWAGYSYVWNEAQDDAVLAPAEGLEIHLPSDLASLRGEAAPSIWRVPTRTECMSCHSRQANFVLGLSELQANCNREYNGAQINQLHALEQQSVIDKIAPSQSAERPHLVDPYDVSLDLESRVRSYLHTNCSSCHVEAGGGNSRIRLDFGQKRDDMQLINVFPQHETFGVPAALLVAPSEPQRSILFQRISRRGPGQMPPRGTHMTDREAIQMFHDWISQLPSQRSFVKDWKVTDLSPSLSQVGRGRSYETGSRVFKEAGCVQCHRFAGSGGGAGPDLSGIGQKRNVNELLESIIEPSKQIETKFAATIVETASGQTFEGRVEQDDDQQLILHTSDALAAPVVLPKSEIAERRLSPTSTMPTRLLNTLQKSEILDLLAYLVANADAKHPAFEK